jgi:predicted protein tyrosine phosphatase
MAHIEAVRFNPENCGRTAMIRVTSYEHIPLEHHEKYVETIRLHFYDVTDYEFQRCEVKKYFPISHHQAKQIVEFVLRNIDVDTMIVHCDAGISRSAAIALACCELLNDVDQSNLIRNSPVYHPNETVQRRILEAAQDYRDTFAYLERHENVPIIVPSRSIITNK